MPTSPGTNAVVKMGVLDVSYVYTFLRTDWINYQGMNNVLLYDSGIYGQSGNATPIRSTTTVTSSTTSKDFLDDSVSNGTFTGASFTENGQIISSSQSDNPPSGGYIYIVRTIGNDGWSNNAIRPFAFPGSSQNNSFVSPGAMWIGDTPKRRGIWLSQNATPSTTIAGICGLPLPTGNPTLPGTLLAGQYIEEKVNFTDLPDNDQIGSIVNIDPGIGNETSTDGNIY
jgi:hypothetical protein